MWLQWRWDHKCVRAQKNRLTQLLPFIPGARENINYNNKSGRKTDTGQQLRSRVHPSICLLPSFIIWRNPVRETVAEKFKREKRKWSRSRRSVIVPSRGTGAKPNESLEINKIPPRVQCSVDNFVSFFLPPKIITCLPPRSFYDSVELATALIASSAISFSK